MKFFNEPQKKTKSTKEGPGWKCFLGHSMFYLFVPFVTLVVCEIALLVLSEVYKVIHQLKYRLYRWY
jgi:hypothetical protein